jgi:hypothetical protein
MRLKLIVFCLWFFGERENQNQIVKSRPRPRYSYRIQPFNRAEPITRVRAAIVTPLEFLLCSLSPPPSLLSPLSTTTTTVGQH